MSDSIIDNMIPSSIIESDYSKQELLELIEGRVTELLQEEPKLLFSYLYRLDIDESKVRSIIHSRQVSGIRDLAQLILERQIARIETKKYIPQKPIEGWQ